MGCPCRVNRETSSHPKPSHHRCHLRERRNTYLGADPRKGSDCSSHHKGGIPSKEAWGVHPVPCTLTLPSGSHQYKYLLPTNANQAQRGVSQSICISDTHIFLKLSPSAYALCVSFFISKMDMIITCLSGSSRRRGDTCSAPRWQHHIPFPFPLCTMCQAMLATPSAPAIGSGDFGRGEKCQLCVQPCLRWFSGMMLPDHYLNIFRVLPQEDFRLPSRQHI